MICSLVVGVGCISVSMGSCSVVIFSTLVGMVQILSVMILLEGSVANISAVLRILHLLDFTMFG